MIYAAINILVLSVFLLLFGLWKPKKLLFWQEKPARFTVIVGFVVLVMIGFTMYGEGLRVKKEALAAQAAKNIPAVVIAPESDLPNTEALK